MKSDVLRSGFSALCFFLFNLAWEVLFTFSSLQEFSGFFHLQLASPGNPLHGGEAHKSTNPAPDLMMFTRP